jgi:hypothetical protein
MTRVEQTATAFSLGAPQKHTLQLFNSIEKGRFRVATGLFEGRGACASAVRMGRHTELAPDEDRRMRLIDRHFFNVNDRFNHVSEA